LDLIEVKKGEAGKIIISFYMQLMGLGLGIIGTNYTLKGEEQK
jgi:hypothetical protein